MVGRGVLAAKIFKDFKRAANIFSDFKGAANILSDFKGAATNKRLITTGLYGIYYIKINRLHISKNHYIQIFNIH